MLRRRPSRSGVSDGEPARAIPMNRGKRQMNKAAQIGAVVVMMSGSLVSAGASAQSKAAYGGMVTITLSDPAGGEPWRVQRQLLRTFSSEQECENLKDRFIAFHIGRVEGFGLVTASDAATLIEVEPIECFRARGSIIEWWHAGTRGKLREARHSLSRTGRHGRFARPGRSPR